MDYYTVPIPPTTYPVTLAEAKLFLKVTHTAEDDLISSLIEAATNVLEAYTGRWFISRDALGQFDSIKYTNRELYPFVEIKRSPLSILSTVQIRSGGAYITLDDDDDYQLKPQYGYDRILFYNNLNVDYEYNYPLRIEFTAGYGVAANVPETIKIAIKQYVNFLYLNRGDCSPVCSKGFVNFQGHIIPFEIATLVAKYKIRRVFA